VGVITGYPSLSSAVPADVLPIVDVTGGLPGLLKDITAGNLAPVISGAFDIVAWGGADPTGGTDAASIVAAAFAAAAAAVGLGAGRVTAPAGTFLINSGTGISVTTQGIVFTGASASPDWSHPTGSGTNFHLGSGFGGTSLFSVSGSGHQVTLAGFAVTSYSSASSVIGVLASGVDGLSLKDILLSQVGGISLSSVTRSVLEDLVTQATNGTYALSCVSSTIVFFSRCNFAPVSTATYAMYFSGCETIILIACQGNNNPAYSLYLLNTNDSTFTDFEANGGSTASVALSGCTDVRFTDLYASGSSTPVYLSVVNSSIVQFIGGWLNNSTGSAVVLDGTGGGTHDVIISGMLIASASASASPVAITATPVYSVVIRGNNIWGHAGVAWITDASSSSGRACTYSGNVIAAGAAPAITGAGAQNVRADGNVSTTGAAVNYGPADVQTVGQGLQVAEGSNAKQGTTALVGGSAVVANTSVTASSRIFLTSQADGGTPGWLRVSNRTAGTNFTITSSSGTDTSTVAYEIFEPG